MKSYLVKWPTSLLIVLLALLMSSTGCGAAKGCPRYPSPPQASDDVEDEVFLIAPMAPALVDYLGKLEAFAESVEHGNAEQ